MPARYLTKVDSAMQELKAAVDGAPCTMLTHSVRAAPLLTHLCLGLWHRVCVTGCGVLDVSQGVRHSVSQGVRYMVWHRVCGTWCGTGCAVHGVAQGVRFMVWHRVCGTWCGTGCAPVRYSVCHRGCGGGVRYGGVWCGGVYVCSAAPQGLGSPFQADFR